MEGIKMDSGIFSNALWTQRWIDYCKEHGIWFAVCADGTVDACTDVGMNMDSCDFGPEDSIQFGTKEAYGWLITEHGAMIAGEVCM